MIAEVLPTLSLSPELQSLRDRALADVQIEPGEVEEADESVETPETPQESQTAEAEQPEPEKPKTPPAGDKKPEAAPKEPKEQKAPEKSESEYSKARKEKERYDRNWQKFEQERQAFREEQQKFARERQEFEQARQKGLDSAAQSKQPSRDGGPSPTEPGKKLTAEDYFEAADDFEKEGKFELADQARKEGRKLHKEEIAQVRNSPPEALVPGNPRFDAAWQAGIADLLKQVPTLGNQEHDDHKAVAGILEKYPELQYIATGPQRAWEVVQLQRQAAKATEWQQKAEAYQKERDQLRAKLHLPAGGPAAAPNAKPADPSSLSLAELREAAMREAEGRDS